MLIAFMGNDGSGKTTLSHAIAAKLKEAGLNVEYRHGGDHFLLAWVQKLFPQKVVNRSRRNFLRQGNRKSFLHKLWPYLVYLDCLALYFKLKRQNRHRITVLDRYFYDLALGYEDLGVGSRLVKRLFFSLPRPDLPIILDAPPELTYERKKADDAGFEYYAVQRQRYLELARSMDIPIVSTNQPFEETLSSVWRRVKKALLTTLEQAVT